MITKNTNDLKVVIRSAHERTEALCFDLVAKQVPPNKVEIIHETPFQAALFRSFEIGISSGCYWTLCIDADVLLRKNAVSDLIDSASNFPESFLGACGHIIDKLRGGKHYGGAHLYRTSMLPKVLSLMPEQQLNIRPESHIKNIMAQNGHEWGGVKTVIGLHDYEQYYCDIFRKMVVRSYKSAGEYSELIKRAQIYSKMDVDFLVSLWGLRVGRQLNIMPVIQARGWRSEIELLLQASGINEKTELKKETADQFFDKVYEQESRKTFILTRWKSIKKIVERQKRKISRHYQFAKEKRS